ncbi:hypothetical protein [Culicoidibacter larvae]|uniref:Uncharacterized protein n=1 Tax=Culicoidibacter larvae TaxID=2579976 RepID=A0A5R8QH49_9FIRM|nr:hypothetical protein [Culicoidibacter larvae]TLG77359.1 hypothetical protein FEZ08_01700 [Culicoidibacter larvae]
MDRNKTILTKKQTALLLYSEHLRQIVDYNFFHKIIRDKEKLTCGKMLDYSMSENQIYLIKSNRDMLLHSAGEEWSYRRRNAVVREKEKDPKLRPKCQLCGARILEKHYIVNKYNKKELFVGSECIKEFYNENLSSDYYNYYRGKKARKFVKLAEEYPTIRRIVESSKYKQYDIAYPLKLEKQSMNEKLLVRKCLEKYLAVSSLDKEDVHYVKLKHYIEAFLSVQKQIDNFCEKNSNNKFILTNKLSESIISNQINGKALVENIRGQHDSVIDKRTASKITVVSFLENYKLWFNENFSNQNFNITKVANGKIYFSYKVNNVDYNFLANSQDFILCINGIFDDVNTSKRRDVSKIIDKIMVSKSDNENLFKYFDKHFSNLFEYRLNATQLLTRTLDSRKRSVRELFIENTSYDYYFVINSEELSVISRDTVKLFALGELFGNSNKQVFADVLFRNKYPRQVVLKKLRTILAEAEDIYGDLQ